MLTTWRPLAAPREEEAEGAAAAGGGRSPAPRGPARCPLPRPHPRRPPRPLPGAMSFFRRKGSAGTAPRAPAGAAPRGRAEGPGAEAGEGAPGRAGLLRVCGAGRRNGAPGAGPGPAGRRLRSSGRCALPERSLGFSDSNSPSWETRLRAGGTARYRSRPCCTRLTSAAVRLPSRSSSAERFVFGEERKLLFMVAVMKAP